MSVCVCVFVCVCVQDGGVDVLSGGLRKKSPWGQWVQYNDKRGRGVFYYNVVSATLHFSRLRLLCSALNTIEGDAGCLFFLWHEVEERWIISVELAV